ncbi:hypothetical protein SK128_004695, partial [Halocaridina rubra]
MANVSTRVPRSRPELNFLPASNRCSSCFKPVLPRQEAFACDECDFWRHRVC